MHRLPATRSAVAIYENPTTVLTIPSDDRDRYHVATDQMYDFGAELTLVVENPRYKRFCLPVGLNCSSALTDLPLVDIRT